MTRTICGDWDLIRHLGGGQFGKVSLWKHKSSNEQIAIKMCEALEAQSLTQPRNAQRWKEEIANNKKIDHVNIVKYKEIPMAIRYGYIKEFQALGMEYCEEGDLRSMLQQINNNSGLREYVFCDFIRDISDALSYLHRNSIIHRDLKPENIVMKKDDTGRIIFKIIDLGYAKNISGQSHAYSLVGTYCYLAPEFWGQQGNNIHTEKVDLWSFGLVAFECITGRRPFYPYKDYTRANREIQSKKSNKHICTAYSMDIGETFSSTIPQPNWLHRTTIESFVPWFQSMFLLDQNKRGGEDWYRDLQLILTEVKMIYVFNTRECKMVNFPAKKNHRQPLPLRQQLAQLNSVTYEDQLILLFEDGNVPDPRHLIESQCISNEGPPRILYVYNKECQFDTSTIGVPQEILEFSKQSRAYQGEKSLWLLRKIICYVNKQFDQCTHTFNSLLTLNESVKKIYSTCQRHGEELNKRYNAFCGKIHLVRSLYDDLTKWTHKHNEVDRELQKDCLTFKEQLDKFIITELPKIDELVQKIVNPVPDITEIIHSNKLFVGLQSEHLQEKKKNWNNSAINVRSTYRKYIAEGGASVPEATARMQQALARMQDLVQQVAIPLDNYSRKIITKVEELIKFLIDAHHKIYSILRGPDTQTVNKYINDQMDIIRAQETMRNDKWMSWTRHYYIQTNVSAGIFERLKVYYDDVMKHERILDENVQKSGGEIDADKLMRMIDDNLKKTSSIVDELKNDDSFSALQASDYWQIFEEYDENGKPISSSTN